MNKAKKAWCAASIAASIITLPTGAQYGTYIASGFGPRDKPNSLLESTVLTGFSALIGTPLYIGIAGRNVIKEEEPVAGQTPLTTIRTATLNSLTSIGLSHSWAQASARVVSGGIALVGAPAGMIGATISSIGAVRYNVEHPAVQ